MGYNYQKLKFKRRRRTFERGIKFHLNDFADNLNKIESL